MDGNYNRGNVVLLGKQIGLKLFAETTSRVNSPNIQVSSKLKGLMQKMLCWLVLCYSVGR